MLVRHYNRNGAKQRKRAMHPDAELDAKLAADEAIRLKAREAATGTLQGIGIVSSTRVLVTRPKHVRRNHGYYAKNGAYITSAEAPYTELMADMKQYRTKSATGSKPKGYTDAELAILDRAASEASLHERRKRISTQQDFD